MDSLGDDLGSSDHNYTIISLVLDKSTLESYKFDIKTTVITHLAHLGERKYKPEMIKLRSREDEKTKTEGVTLRGTRPCKNIFGTHHGAGKKPFRVSTL